jgi:hypothetical protein
MLDVYSGLSEEGKWGEWARRAAVRGGSGGAEEPIKAGVAPTVLVAWGEVRER